MKVFVVEMIEKGYRPEDLKTKISDSIELNIDTMVYYEYHQIIGVCDTGKRSIKLIDDYKERLIKRYGEGCLKEIIREKDKPYFSFGVSQLSVLTEEGGDDEQKIRYRVYP